MANIYDYRSGRSIKGVNPQAVGQEFERIRNESGELTPANVLEAAEAPESPLHGAFEWDDSAAAKQHRLAQARRLIVSVRVINGPSQVPVPAFVSVRTADHGRNYIPTVEAMSSEELRARVLSEARQFVESLERRYRHFSEVADVLSRLKQQVG